jgi:hypothetical protein
VHDAPEKACGCAHGVDQRGFLTAGTVGLGAAALAAAGTLTSKSARAGESSDPYADPAEPMLPASDMAVDARTALVITDPQIDFLDPSGIAWGAVGGSVEANGTVANIGRLLDAAKSVGMTVSISPHYYYPTDHGWRFSGPLEMLMHAIGMFDRPSAYNTEGFAGSGADFMPQYKAQILDGETIVTSPHKV